MIYGDASEDGLLAHPDRFARNIAGCVSAACIEKDPCASVDIHVTVGPKKVYCAGNVTAAGVDECGIYDALTGAVNQLSEEAGYDASRGFNPENVEIILDLNGQAPDLNSHKQNNHAGDSRPFAVYLSKDTPEFKPLSVAIVDDLVREYSERYDMDFRNVATQNGKVQAAYDRAFGRVKVTLALQVDPRIKVDESALKELRSALNSNVIQPVISDRYGKEYLSAIVPFTGSLDVDTGDSSTKNGCGGIQPFIGGNPYGKNAKVEDFGNLLAKGLGIKFLENSEDTVTRCFSGGSWSIGNHNPDALYIDPLGAAVDEARLNGLVMEHLKKTPEDIIQQYDLRNPAVIRKIGRDGLFEITPVKRF